MSRRDRDDRDLERRVRAALAARAASAQPDPATWQVVQRRIRRGAWLRIGGIGLVTAAVVALAVVAVPGLIRPSRQIDFAAATDPPATPSPAVTPPADPSDAGPQEAVSGPPLPAAGVDPADGASPGDEAGRDGGPTAESEPVESRADRPAAVPGSSETPTDRTSAVSVAFLPSEGPCGEALVLVERQVPALTPLRGALEAMLAGPSGAEAALGYTTAVGDGPGLLHGVNIRDGVATVDLAAAALPGSSGSSCQILAVTEQLDATVGQFPTVERATYRIDGSVERFATWAQSAPQDYTERPVP